VPEKFIVSAGGEAGLRLTRGEQLRIIDIEGGQTGDLVALMALFGISCWQLSLEWCWRQIPEL
jgi:hypothetical protein